MLFVVLYKVKGGTAQERMTRRLEWQPPEGLNIMAEYWLQTADPHVIAIFEADSYAPIMQANAAWDDVFEATVIPAIRAEDGIELAKKMRK